MTSGYRQELVLRVIVLVCHRYQEQERNRSRDCSGTYPNCCQLSPTDSSCAGVSLFPQVSGVGG
jgi:hypothetical protein